MATGHDRPWLHTRHPLILGLVSARWGPITGVVIRSSIGCPKTPRKSHVRWSIAFHGRELIGWGYKSNPIHPSRLANVDRRAPSRQEREMNQSCTTIGRTAERKRGKMKPPPHMHLTFTFVWASSCRLAESPSLFVVDRVPPVQRLWLGLWGILCRTFAGSPAPWVKGVMIQFNVNIRLIQSALLCSTCRTYPVMG